MFAGLKPHASHQVTSSPWLKTIPSHWRLARAKSLLREHVVKGFPSEPLLAATQSHGVIRKSDYGNRTVSATKDLHLLKLVEVGDFVISLRSFQGGIERCHHRGIISPAYTVLRAKSDAYRDYLTYLFKSKPFVSSLTLAVTGIREGQSIDYSQLAVELLPVPPADEQAAIVKYLTHANARIDKAIAAKRQLAALFDEQRRAIANELVTKGLAHERLQATGIAWLPDVPEGWDVAPLKRYWSVTDCKHLTVPFVDEGIPLASVSQAQRFYLDLSDAKRTDAESYEHLVDGGRRPQRGDLIYCRNVGVGAAAVVDTDEVFAMGQDVCLLRSAGQDPVFLNHFLRSNAMKAQLEMILVGSTFRRINVEDVRALTIVVPPIEEQRNLTAIIETNTHPMAVAIAKAKREIELLREFRARLVADVVTGQLDVRGAAAALHEADPETVLVDAARAAADGEFEDMMETSGV